MSRRARSTTGHRVYQLLVPITLSALLLLCACALAAAPQNVKTVVVLIPNNADGSPGGTQLNQGLRATFAAAAEHVQIRFEPLDISRFRDKRGRGLLADFLRQKYAGQDVGLVIAALAPSLDFALEYRDKIFPGVPVMFVAVDEEEVRTRPLPADVIGVSIDMDLVGTLEFALRLQPETRRMFVVAGRSSFDTRWEDVARQRFRPYENRLEFVYLSALSMDDLLKQVANLPDRSIVQYLHIFEDVAGKTFIPADALKMVAAKANAPIYSHVGSYIGHGIVGGHVFSFELAGKSAASLGLRILAGERPETISRPAVSSNEYVVDWRWSFMTVDTSKPFAEDTYYEIERSIVAGKAHSTCGGRWLNCDAIDTILTWMINRDNGPRISDGVDAPAVPARRTFPYLVPPEPNPPRFLLQSSTPGKQCSLKAFGQRRAVSRVATLWPKSKG